MDTPDYFADDVDIVAPETMAEMEAAGASPAINLVPDADPEPPADDREADAPQRAAYETASGLGGPLPTERPDDPTVRWSPRPGIVGCDAKGYKKIRVQ